MERLTQLQLIDKAKRTHEEALELQRLLTARTRAKKPAKKQWEQIISIGEACGTMEEFYQANLRNVDEETLKNWLELQESVDIQLRWMRTWHEQDPNDELFVGLDEGREDLQDFIKTVGFIKDADDYSSSMLKSFKPIYAIWATKTLDDSYYRKFWGGSIRPYFKDSERLAALCEENEPTKVQALYGLRIGIPEYHYTRWCQDVAAKPAVLLAG